MRVAPASSPVLQWDPKQLGWGGAKVSRYLAILGAAAAMFAAGVVVGQGILPAKAQTPATEEKAAAIKANLVEKITAFNSEMPAEVFSRINGTGPVNVQYQAEYLYGLAGTAKDDILLAHYLRYMAPVLRYFFISSDTLVDDRYLNPFAQEMGRSGVPPVVPPIPDADFNRLGPRSVLAGGLKLDNWPYSAGAASAFGEW